MRRRVSELAMETGALTDQVLETLIGAGHLETQSSEHIQQWSRERGAYKAGAAVFSDLEATGVKMLTQEARLIERELSPQAARTLQKKIAAPINHIAKNQTVIEAFAESFELFILAQSQKHTPLGRACKKACTYGLIDNDPDENRAAMDPALSWLHDKDGDLMSNQRTWRAFLRELPHLFPPPPVIKPGPHLKP
jgi:hypothetical protein